MKKKMIAGIVVAIAVVCVGGASIAVYASDHGSNSEIAENKTTTQNKQVTSNKMENNSKSNNENSNTTVNKNLNEMQAANTINIGKNEALSGSSQGYLDRIINIGKWGTKEGEKREYQCDAGVVSLNSQMAKKYIAVKDDINSTIKENVSSSVGEALDSQDNIWQNYIKSENRAITKDSGEGGTIVSVNQEENYSGIEQQEASFNVYNYMMDTQLSPEMPLQYFTDNMVPYEKGSSEYARLTMDQKDYINGAIEKINNLQKSGNEIVNTAIARKTSIEVAYNQVYYIWNNYLNKLYGDMINKSDYKNMIKQEEIPWVNFKEEMINSEKLAYKNKTELDLAQAKMNIRLTQEQVFTILSYETTI